MSRNNTGNPIGSKAYPDFEDNVPNLDVAVNSDQDTWRDRLGKSRLTWAGIVKAGTGDPSIAVDAAARAESAASSVEQNAEQIAQDAAEQAAQDVVAGVDGAVAEAKAAATSAAASAEVIATAGRVFPTSAEGQGSPTLSTGEYFWVESSGASGVLELWRKGASAPSDTGKTMASGEAVRRAESFAATGRYDAAWVSGGLNSSTGALFPRPDRIRIAHKVALLGYVTVSVSNPEKFCSIFLYREDGSFWRATANSDRHENVAVPGYFSVVMGWGDNSNINPTDGDAEILTQRDDQYRPARNIATTGRYPVRLTQGGINPTTGALNYGADRVRLAEERVPLTGYVSAAVAGANQLCGIARYDAVGQFLGVTQNAKEHTDVAINGYFSVIVRNTSNAAISPSEVDLAVSVRSGAFDADFDRLTRLATTGEYLTTWVSGGLEVNTGVPVVRPTRLRMKSDKTPLDGNLRVATTNRDQWVTVFKYGRSGEFLGFTETAGLIEESIQGFFNVTVRNIDDSEIDPAESSAVITVGRSASSQADEANWLEAIPRFSSVPFGYSINLPFPEKEALFESLLASYPAEVVKEKIGESFNGVYEVNAYTVTPTTYELTIAITMHTHGNEKYNPAGFFALLGEISKPGPLHPFLVWLRSNVRWVIVPFVSPTAYVAGTRYTNGVDLNRNFDYRWSFSAATDKGSYPNSQVEVQNIIGFFTGLRDQIDYHMDLHDIPGVGSYSHCPYNNQEFLWQNQMGQVRDYLAAINQGVAGPKYVGDVGSQNNFFNGNLGVPSMVPEHVSQWWINLGLSGDQQVAKATEQTAAFLLLFKHLYEFNHGSAFYSRLFERSFGSQEYGYSGWGSEDVESAFAVLPGVTTAGSAPGVFERTGDPGAKTILLIAGVQPDDNNSSLVALRCLERIGAGREMYVEHLQKCNFVIVPVINPSGAAESTLQTVVIDLLASYQPDYTVVVRAPTLDEPSSDSVVRIGNAGGETAQTKDSGLQISTDKVGIENYLSTPYSVFDLGNQVVSAGVYSHCVAEWVKYVLNDMASFNIS